jgi:hypothetical protein
MENCEPFPAAHAASLVPVTRTLDIQYVILDYLATPAPFLVLFVAPVAPVYLSMRRMREQAGYNQLFFSSTETSLALFQYSRSFIICAFVNTEA